MGFGGDTLVTKWLQENNKVANVSIVAPKTTSEGVADNESDTKRERDFLNASNAHLMKETNLYVESKEGDI